MYDDINEVHHHPSAFRLSRLTKAPDPHFLESRQYFCEKRLEMGRTGTGRNHHVVGNVRYAPYVEEGDVFALLVLQRTV